MYEKVIIDDLSYKEIKSNSNPAKLKEVQLELKKLEVPVFSFEEYKKSDLDKSKLKTEKQSYKLYLMTNPVFEPNVKFQTMAGKSIKQLINLEK